MHARLGVKDEGAIVQVKKENDDAVSSMVWCVCDNCQHEDVVAKQRCCGYAPNMCTSITMNDELIEAVTDLTEDDLNNSAVLFTHTNVPDSIDDCTNTQLRLICYRKIFRLVHGIGQTDVKVVLSSCVRKLVSQFYP